MAQNEKASVKATSADTGPSNQAPEGWVKEQIGFPPYWNPKMKMDEDGRKTVSGTGNSFLGTPIQIDERDPNFTRFVVEAARDLECQKGPADDAEKIVVKKGEFFTLSTYASLPLQDYFGYEVFVQPTRKRKLATNAENPEPRDLWDFDLQVSPETSKLLKQRRSQEAILLREKQERYRLEQIEKEATNPL